MLIALVRGLAPIVLLNRRTPDRLTFTVDQHHPIGGAHHQKIVVIDDCLAFAGGIDVTTDRWDTSEHLDRHPLRRRPSSHRLTGPWHDVTSLVSGPAALHPARAREQGFREQMAELGLDPACCVSAPFSEEGGSEAARHLLARRPAPTALYCGTLGQAIGALHAVRVLGLRVPEDVSVVSYDDLPLADYLSPPLTTVAMPLLELGAAAVDAVLDQLEGAAPHDVGVPTQPVVVTRASTGRVPTA